MTDVIVVGSGPGGVNAAAALVEAGRQVVMLDVGVRDERYEDLVPRRDFTTIRYTDEEQHRYFLGDDFEGVPFGPVRVGAQLTPPRQHIVADDPRIASTTDGFAAVQSFARGGLGAGWGAGVFPFTGDDLAPMGVTLADMQPHYDAVVRRIGVAGPPDDLDPFFPASPDLLPALELDSNAETVFAAYEQRREAMNQRGFFLGRTRLAVATRAHDGRGPESYRDMAYWADPDRSVYRPQWTLEQLERMPGFTYLAGRLVRRFVEDESGVTVETTCLASGSGEEHRAPVLVLAAGTFGSARIALRSLERWDTPVPILCNPYTYVPTVNVRALGGSVRDRRSGMAQMTAMLQAADGSDRVLQAQVFSYRSLLTFKLMKEVPLGYRASRRALQVMMPYFTILGIHHEDRPTDDKHCVLSRSGDGDSLAVVYQPSKEEVRRQRRDERRLLRAFMRLGLAPLKVMRLGHGSNMHYAGTLPMRPDGGDLTCDVTGRLRPTRAVYVADGAIFPWIPAKGLTFTLMSHANRVGMLLGKTLA